MERKEIKVETVGASAWSGESVDNKGMFKLMVEINGKAVKHSV